MQCKFNVNSNVAFTGTLFHNQDHVFTKPPIFNAQLIESATHKVVEEVIGQKMFANNRGHDFHFTFKHGLQPLNPGIHLIVVQVFDGAAVLDSACNVLEAVR